MSPASHRVDSIAERPPLLSAIMLKIKSADALVPFTRSLDVATQNYSRFCSRINETFLEVTGFRVAPTSVV